MVDNETIQLMQSHRSVRKFTDQSIPKEDLVQILKAGQGAPSSHFVQAYSVITITDQEKKDKIAEFANNQEQVKDCAVFLLFCADMKRLEYAAKKHNTEFAYDTLENFIVGIVDTSLVAQNVLTAAEALGYGGCYIGGIRNNPEPISKIVALPDKVFPVFGMTLGVPAQNPEVKPRLPIDCIVHQEEYSEKNYNKAIEEYDQQLKEYYSSRSHNNKDADWSGLMAKFFSKERRKHLKRFLKERGFHLK